MCKKENLQICIQICKCNETWDYVDKSINVYIDIDGSISHYPAQQSCLKSLGATADWWYVGCIATEAHRQISTHICKSPISEL